MPRPTLRATPQALAVLALCLSCASLHAQTANNPLDLLQRFLPPSGKTSPSPAPAPTLQPPQAAPALEAAPRPGPSATANLGVAEPSTPIPPPSASTTSASTTSDNPSSSAGVAPVALGCRPLTDQALSADLKSATAQQQKADPTEQAKLLDSSIALWAQAVTQCDGRSKDRAQRNLSDSIKARAALQDLLGSDPQCANAQKNATSLQDLARQAFGERRWTEAAALYRKAEDQWDVATERCTGTAQDVAQRRREQAEIDGYNAEFCAPVYDKAREVTQRTRSLAPGMSREEKQDALQLSETLWRDALGVCKGVVQDTARSNVQALARERGTPWVDTRQAPGLGNLGQLTNLVSPSNLVNLRPSPTAGATPTSAAATAPSTSPSSNSPATPSPRAALPVATSAAASTALSAGSTAVSTAAGTAASAAQAAASAEPGKVMPSEFTAGTARFTGQFSLDAGGKTYTGQGRIFWANGDIYEGTLVRGQKHGQGRFVWANGQRYDGDWFQDKPTGKANVQFANGNVYNGTVIDGIPNGQGRMVYAGGDVYVGELKNGYPDGRGTQTWPSGQRYEGEWQQQQPNGQGRMQFATGEVYSGQFSNGMPNGEGSFTWPNGDQYSGQWLMGKKHGQGVFTWKNGDRWEGIYDNDQQTAQGRQTAKATP